MIHLNRRTYPYMEEVNEGIVREFRRLGKETGRVLDVGCGRGQLGEEIRKLGWEVWGVEQAGAACGTARTRLDRLIEADLHDMGRIQGSLDHAPFDALIFSDVLEHVYDPRTVLEQYLSLIRPGGRVFISVPNMVVWTNRLKLMFGRVDYTPTGVMDETHIRFFTFASASQLVEAVGCKIVRTASTPHLVRAFLPLLKALKRKTSEQDSNPRAIIDSRGYQMYMKYFYPFEQWFASLWRTMFAFRIIIVGQKPGQLGVSLDACGIES